MQPIATYEDRLPDRRHRYELLSDAIYVRGSTLQTEVETTIPLVQLQPSIMRIWIYSYLFYVGYWTFLVGIVLMLAVVFIVMIQDPQSFPTKAMGLMCGIASVGMVLIILNRQKIECAQFRSDAGVSILGIAKSGKNAGDFDRFVALLEKQIRIARGQGGFDGSSLQHGANDA